MSQATLEQAQQDNLDREDLRRIQKVIHSFGEGKARESELQADYIDEILCACGDEYSLFCSWATMEVVFRDKDCKCPIDPSLERRMVALHHQTKSHLMPGLEEAEARYDEYDNFND